MLSKWSRAVTQISRVGSQCNKLGLFNVDSAEFRRDYAEVSAVSAPSSSSPLQPSFDSGDFFGDAGVATLDKLFWSKPSSLALANDSPIRVEEPNYEGIYRFILKLMLFYSKQSQSIRGANVVYRRVLAQVDNPAIYDVFNLEKTFKTTFSLLVLHMWLCLRRLKEDGKEGVEFGQHVYEIYNHDVELRVSKAGVNLLLTKWMKDLEKIFYGNIVAYDAALLPEAKKDDLTIVLWRNVLGDDAGSEPNGDARHIVQAMARYVRHEVSCLSLTDKEAMFSGNFMFTPLVNPPHLASS